MKRVRVWRDAVIFDYGDGDNPELNEIIDKAAEANYDINLCHPWWDWIEEQVREIGHVLGWDVGQVYFDLYYRQACVNLEREGRPDVKKAAMYGEEIEEIAKDLKEVEDRHPNGLWYKLRGDTRRSEFLFEEYDEGDPNYDDRMAIRDIVSGFSRLVLKWLEADYEYRTSREGILETLIVNGYPIDPKTGEIAHRNIEYATNLPLFEDSYA